MDLCALSDTQRERVEQWLRDCPHTGDKTTLSALSYNLRRVLELRYGLADGHHYSVEETAKVMRKTKQWVLEIEAGAILMLYQFLVPAEAVAAQ